MVGNDDFPTHTELLDFAAKLGYKDIDPGGICYGLCAMAMQAMLVGEFENFNNRLKKIKDCLKGQHELTQEDGIDFSAFFDGVMLNFEPGKHPDFQIKKNYTHYQNMVDTMQVAGSVKLDEAGGLKK